MNTIKPTPRSILRILICLLGLLGLTALAAPASAAPAPAPQGWVRLAHLSPDTKAVDVELTAAAGGGQRLDLRNVAYGDVTDYMKMPVGTYVLSMRAAGAGANTAPVISKTIDVSPNQPRTIAALGTTAHLVLNVYDDDLRTPGPGQANVRVLQASTKYSQATVETAAGAPLAENVKTGQDTGYATVKAGPWEITATGSTGTVSSQPSSATVNLAPASTNTLLVLDNAAGTLTIKAVQDSAAPAAMPVGGVNTGAVPASEHSGSALGLALIPWAAMVLVIAAVAATAPQIARRRRLGNAAAVTAQQPPAERA